MTLNELKDAHPYGVYSERFSCYYTVDYDNEMGYFKQLDDGSFDDNWNFVDFDTLGNKMRYELERIAAYIFYNM